jgi:hypothetical protein
MERWEIGDIASKIGQLYYNYYLRAAEIRFLHESYVFYEAIRSRAYFAQSATDPNLAIKQLRYFARFIIICLLLNRREVRDRPEGALVTGCWGVVSAAGYRWGSGTACGGLLGVQQTCSCTRKGRQHM